MLIVDFLISAATYYHTVTMILRYAVIIAQVGEQKTMFCFFIAMKHQLKLQNLHRAFKIVLTLKTATV